MLNALIRFSLRSRPLVLAVAILLMVLGVQTAMQLPVEVLPDMTRPTVTILTECPGLAPEEVEQRVTQPIESAVQGVSGLERLRSSSDVSLSLVFAEFDWGTDIYRARQLVQERMNAVSGLPPGVQPGMTPVSSLMGEVLLVGLSSPSMAPRDLRTLADTTIRRRLQSIRGVAEVLTIGGGVKQVEVQPDPARMTAHGVTLAELESAVSQSVASSTSGYLSSSAQEIMVRNLAMTTDLGEIGSTLIKTVGERPILMRDVATVTHGVAVMRGEAGVNGKRGVILSIDKAPGFDTIRLSAEIEKALDDLKSALPADVTTEILFRQSDFIGHAIANLKEAIRDGAIMVTIVLLLFLLNFRTTLITLTAIPLSFAVTLLIFRAFGISVNSMTLGGLAVAIGMVVDDAIVDVENVFRRLRENAALSAPKPRLEVIATASGEVRNSILYATLLVILVFLPLLGLEGLEGRLFIPIAIATIASMAASFVVSLTVIPVLCSLLLKPKAGAAHADGFLVRTLKRGVELTFLRLALKAPLAVLAVVAILLAGAFSLYPVMGKEFLPTFNEGSATISMAAGPGTSLEQAVELGESGERILMQIPEVKSVGRRTGRAERDDHVMPVSVTEYDVEFREGGRPREVVFKEIRSKLSEIPGIFVNVGQPIGHRLAHMLSGVSAKIAIKVYGPDLETLRRVANEIGEVGKVSPGLTDVQVEKQMPIPQLRIEPDRERAPIHDFRPGDITDQLASLIGGKPLAELREGQQMMDLVMRLPPGLRSDPARIAELPLENRAGRPVPLRLVANVNEATGPNAINRENGMRRVVVSANTTERDLQSIVLRLRRSIEEKVRLPEGVYLSYEGEFQAQQEASKRIALLSGLVLLVISMLLAGYFRSLALAAQVLLNIPLALMGGLYLTWDRINNVSIATMVGFIAVAGVAARNSIMMLSHYLHLMKHEAEGFTPAMIIRGTLERLVPVLMTALSAGIALIPLVGSAGEPGKEILHPVAVVIVGGLVSSTLLDLVVTPAVFWAFGRRSALRAVELNAAAAH